MNRSLKILIFAVLLPLLVIAAAVLGARWFIQTRPQPQRVKAELVAPLVRVRILEARDEQIWLRAMGTVQPSRQVTLQPEVTGRILEQSPALVPGGLLEAGELVARIDDRDYRLAVDQAMATVERSRSELKVEEGRALVAAREWEGLQGRIDPQRSSKDLALRKPQLANARASLAGAESGLARARLAVERCSIHAPFNAMVESENVDLGQVVGPQTKLATLFGVDEFWVQVALPVERLSWIRIPESTKSIAASRALIQQGNGIKKERPGRVLRLLGDLDPAGRMARIIVAVDAPLEKICVGDTPCPPLLLGSYVAVDLEGPLLKGVIAIPRDALREGNRVWIADGTDHLTIRTVEVLWRRKTDVLVRTGVSAGERLVVSGVPAPLPGMQLRILPSNEDDGKERKR